MTSEIVDAATDLAALVLGFAAVFCTWLLIFVSAIALVPFVAVYLLVDGFKRMLKP